MKFVNWQAVNTNAGFCIRAEFNDGTGRTRYIAQFIPDEESANLMASAERMRSFIKRVLPFLDNHFKEEAKGLLNGHTN